MPLLLLKIKKHLAFFILGGILKRIRPSDNIYRNQLLLKLSRDIDEKIRGVDRELSRRQDGLILFSTEFDGLLECSNIFMNRLGNDVRKRMRGAEADELLALDLQTKEEDEDFKSP